MKARINIETIQDLGGAGDKISLMTEGMYLRQGDAWVVKYVEKDQSGFAGTVTRIEVYDDHMVVDRKGPLTARMEFRAGSSNRFPYQTEYGMSLLGIHTRSFTADLGKDGGSLSIRYMIDIDSLVSGENRLDMTVGKI